VSQQFAMPGLLESEPNYWLTPPDVMAHLNLHFGPFDFDPIPYPRPKDYEALANESLQVPPVSHGGPSRCAQPAIV